MKDPNLGEFTNCSLIFTVKNFFTVGISLKKNNNPRYWYSKIFNCSILYRLNYKTNFIGIFFMKFLNKAYIIRLQDMRQIALTALGPVAIS